MSWWLVWSVMQALLLYWLGLEWPVAVTDSLVFNVILAIACVMLCYIMQFYLPQHELHWYILFISIFFSGITVFSGDFFMRTIWNHDQAYLSLLKYSFPVRWSINFLEIISLSMICIIWYSLQDQQAVEKRKTDAEAMSREAELMALRRQLQPHFLFNSLNSISALAGSRPEEARNMIHQLSDFLRGTIRKYDHQVTTLSEELEQLRLYLSIEEVRFGHRLHIDFIMDEGLKEMTLPALILQPVVENAIKFGLYDTIGMVSISIGASFRNGLLNITVINPFDPDTAPPKKGEGFGLSSVKRRLYLIYTRNDLVETLSVNKQFTTIVKIPQ